MENRLCDLFSALEPCFPKNRRREPYFQENKDLEACFPENRSHNLFFIVKHYEKKKWTMHKTVIAVQIIQEKLRKGSKSQKPSDLL